MRLDRLLVDRAPLRKASLSDRVQALAQIVLGLALLATLALLTLAHAPEGLQQLLLLCLLRLAVLVCVGIVSFRALSTAGSSCGDSHSPRSKLLQAALYLQLAWLATEIVLGSALLIAYPYLVGYASEGGSGTGASVGALLTLLPLCCTAAMSGCFLFLQRLTRRRRQRASPHTAMECGSGSGCATSYSHPQLSHPQQQQQAAGGYCGSVCSTAGDSQVDIICSPLSDAGSFSSAASGSSSSYYARVSASGGAPSPTGHVRCGSEVSEAHHEAAIQAACEIILMEHQVRASLESSEYVMFVHKRLRPIKTRPEDKSKRQQPGLLRELITNSFSYQSDPELAAQLAASMRAVAGGGGGGNTGDSSNGACSLTFQTALPAGA